MPLYQVIIEINCIEANDEADAREHALKLLKEGDNSVIDGVHVKYLGEVS